MTALAGAIRTKWTPHAVQEPVLANDAGIDICVGGVGSGKSQVAALKFLRWVARHPRKKDGRRPAQGLILGKDFANAAGSQFKVIRERVAELGIPPDRIIVKERGPGMDHKPELHFWNGVVATAYTGTDPDSTRSYEADFLWVDEGECMNAIALVTAIGRLRDAGAIRAIVSSNPEGGGWIYPMLAGENPEWDEIRRATDVRFYRWRTQDNPHADPRVVRSLQALYRATSPGLERQEIGGRFLGTSEAPGSQVIEWVRAFVGKVALEEGEDRALVVGADLGKTEDFCWFTALSAAGVALAMDRFNLHEIDVTDADFWPFVCGRLIEFTVAQGARVIVLDAARGGDQFAAYLREEIARQGLDIEVIEIHTDKGGQKTDVVEALGKAIGMGRVVVPASYVVGRAREAKKVEHVERLRLELKKLVVKKHGMSVRYTHPPGGHDDGVVSLALANRGLALRGGDLEGDYSAFADEEGPTPRGGPSALPSADELGGFGVGIDLGHTF